MKSNIAYFYAAGAILLWGSTASVIKLLLVNLSSVQILFYASLFATIFLFTIAWFRGALSEVRNYALRDYVWFAAMGFVGVFLYYVCFYLALSYLSAQEAFIINYLWPIFIVLFAVPILAERFTVTKLIAVLLSFCGVLIVATNGNVTALSFESPLGVGLAVLGAASYGLFSTLGKLREYDRFASMGFYYLATFIYCILTIGFIGGIAPITSTMQLFGLLWVGLGTCGLAFALWFMALKHGDTAKISNLAFITPFLSLVYIHFLLGEPILTTSLLGLLLIVSGIVFQALRKNV